MNILITSFGPFDNFKVNPSTEVLENLKNSLQIPAEHNISYKVLDVSYGKIDSFIESDHPNYDLIIHLGVATNNDNMRIELVAKNEKAGKDVDGVVFTSKEIVEGLNELNTNFPMETLKEIVDNYPDKIQFSLDAGNYLCNYIYYKSLNQFKTGNIVFIHIADYLNSNNAVSVSNQTNIILDLINSHIYS